jgi:NodT family efflux transporter outer membrane factor (OMF) lipoprotein
MMKRTLTFFITLALLVLILSGCITTLGPDYQVPTETVQADWIESKHPLVKTSPPVTSEWWQRTFQDPILDQLVETALAENLSLRSAGLRVLQARQRLAIATGSRYPQQQQLAGWAGVEGDNSNSFESYGLEFNLSWEADLWGRFKRQIESASALLDASAAGYDGVMVSLIAQVAQNYLLIRTNQQRLAVTKRNLELQAESVRITTAKFDAGATSPLDVDQAQTLFYNTEAEISSIELSMQQLKNALAVLLGQPPHDMSALLGTMQPIAMPPPEIALGMPQDLIRRRPDIRVAERQLAAQSAQIGFAITDLYPHFGIGGAVSTSVSTAEGLDFGDLFSSASFGYNLLGTFQWNIFNYGRLKNNIRLQDAVFQQQLEDYRQTMLQAQGEVENAIVAYLKSHQQLRAYRSAADAAQRAADASTLQYKEGLINFNTVLSTLQTLLNQQDTFVSVQGSVNTNLVEVYKSLGGGWEVRQSENLLDLIPDKTKEEMLERTKYWEKVLEKSPK